MVANGADNRNMQTPVFRMHGGTRMTPSKKITCPACLSKSKTGPWKMKGRGAPLDQSTWKKRVRWTDAGRARIKAGQKPLQAHKRNCYTKIKRPAAYRILFACENPACAFSFGIVGPSHQHVASAIPGAERRIQRAYNKQAANESQEKKWYQRAYNKQAANESQKKKWYQRQAKK